jgi:hypothetical protein
MNNLITFIILHDVGQITILGTLFVKVVKPKVEKRKRKLTMNEDAIFVHKFTFKFLYDLII